MYADDVKLNVDDLGAFLDIKLKFSDHISSIVNKARDMLVFLLGSQFFCCWVGVVSLLNPST